MLTRHSKIYLCSLAGVLFFSGPPVRQLSAPTPSRAQADEAMSSQNPAPRTRFRRHPNDRGVELFRSALCQVPRGGRNRQPGASPSPRDPRLYRCLWQARQTDAELRASILDGKGMEMPAQRGEISEEQVGGLVAYVRTFARTEGKPGDGRRRACAGKLR